MKTPTIKQFIAASVMIHGLLILLILPALTQNREVATEHQVWLAASPHTPLQQPARKKKTAAADAARTAQAEPEKPVPAATAQKIEKAEESTKRYTVADENAAPSKSNTSSVVPQEKTVTAGGKQHPLSQASEVYGEQALGSSGAAYFIKRVMPAYPPVARRLGKEAVVNLRLTISQQGKLEKVELLNDPGFGFGEAAITAIERSTYHPATLNGVAVASRAQLKINFRLG